MSKKPQRYDAAHVRDRLTRRRPIRATVGNPRLVPLVNEKTAAAHARAFDAIMGARPKGPPGRDDG